MPKTSSVQFRLARSSGLKRSDRNLYSARRRRELRSDESARQRMGAEWATPTSPSCAERRSTVRNRGR